MNSRAIVTGKLRPYGAARREVMPSAAWGRSARSMRWCWRWPSRSPGTVLGGHPVRPHRIRTDVDVRQVPLFGEDGASV